MPFGKPRKQYQQYCEFHNMCSTRKQQRNYEKIAIEVDGFYVLYYGRFALLFASVDSVSFLFVTCEEGTYII